MRTRTRKRNAGRRLAAAGGGGFDPSSLVLAADYAPGPATCFTDAAGTTPAAVGQSVARITDSSGNGRHRTQPGTLSQRPILRQNGSGVYYLDYDGVIQELLTATVAGFTVGGLWVAGRLVAIAGAEVPAFLSSQSKVIGPRWFPNATTLYGGDAGDLLFPFVNTVNGVATNTSPAAGTSAVYGQYPAGAAVAGVTSLTDMNVVNGNGSRVYVGRLVVLAAVPSAAARAALDAYFAARLP